MAFPEFRSPGVFKQETDLSFVRENLGVTTLGLVGEATCGPAFEPTFITNYNQFRECFGGLSKEQYVDEIGTTKPRYEAGYIAKSYLSESNQMWFTRVLGYSGMDKGSAWVITAEIDGTPRVVATLRSRGDWTTINVGTPPFETSTCALQFCLDQENPDSVTIDIGSMTDVFDSFDITYTDINNNTVTFNVSLDSGAPNFINKVLRSDCGDQPCLYVDEMYSSYLRRVYEDGLAMPPLELKFIPGGNNPLGIQNFESPYRSAETPWVLSEIRGGMVRRLFKFVTNSDGDCANTLIKISIENISFNSRTFDVVIRDYFDTDRAPRVLERFPRLNFDPQSRNYIGRAIGDVTGEFENNSKYVKVDMGECPPLDAIPAGFEGYTIKSYFEGDLVSGLTLTEIPTFDQFGKPTGTTTGYTTEWTLSGATEIEPPQIAYNTEFDEATQRANRHYFGLSDLSGIDSEFFRFQGFQGQNVCEAGESVSFGSEWTGKTNCFHLDSRAVTAIIGNKQGDVITDCEFTTTDCPFIDDFIFENPRLRKFTLMPAGGWDGWDAHRATRSNTDGYKAGRTFVDDCFCKYDPGDRCLPLADLPEDTYTSDYYAFRNAALTFRNPESTAINLFATAGLFLGGPEDGNCNLITDILEMVEARCDALYIINMCYFDCVETAAQIVQSCDLDSSFAATYYEWLMIYDSENGVNCWLPPTLEVVREMARTDNLSFPWFSTMGLNRGVTRAKATGSPMIQRRILTQEERNILYENNINPIAWFRNEGGIIWGNKTLQFTETALNRINVRRLLLQAQRLIADVARRFVGEPNDQRARDEFLSLVNPILENIRSQRGLTEFRVELSNDPADFDENKMCGRILLKPTRSIEFICLNYTVTNSDVSFDEV